jgi:hypothetical protein
MGRAAMTERQEPTEKPQADAPAFRRGDRVVFVGGETADEMPPAAAGVGTVEEGGRSSCVVKWPLTGHPASHTFVRMGHLNEELRKADKEDEDGTANS